MVGRPSTVLTLAKLPSGWSLTSASTLAGTPLPFGSSTSSAIILRNRRRPVVVNSVTNPPGSTFRLEAAPSRRSVGTSAKTMPSSPGCRGAGMTTGTNQAGSPATFCSAPKRTAAPASAPLRTGTACAARSSRDWPRASTSSTVPPARTPR